MKMLERLEHKCKSLGLTFRHENMSSTKIDCYINDIPIQCKYRGPKNSGRGYNYPIYTRKKISKKISKHGYTAYSESDPFVFMIAEIGGPPENPFMYNGNFIILSKKLLIERGVLSTVETKGKGSCMICPPDSDKDHWSKPYWNRFDLLK